MKKENNKLIPKLRFREFEGEWQKDSTKKLVSFIKDGTHGTHKDTPDGGHYLLSAKNIVNGAIILNDDERKISKSEFDKITRSYRLKENDILVTIVGSIGQLALHKHQTNYAFQRSVAFLRFSKIEPKYAFHYLNSYYYQNELMKRKVTSAQPGIYLGELSKIDISFPSHPEQQKIASFLTAVDKLIEKLTKKKKLLEEYKKGIMQKIFNKEIRFKDKNRNDFPEWEEKRLGEYIEQRSERNSELSITNVLSVNNKLGFIPQSSQFDNRNVASNDLSNYKIVRKNYYAYNPSRINVGSIARLKTTNCGVVSPMYVVFEINKNMSPNYFDILIQTHRFKHLVIVGCTGSVRDSLNIDDLKDFRFKVPKLEEQNHISQFFKKIEIKISMINTLIVKTGKYKKGLLQQMFI